MAAVKESVDIDAPPERVWAVVHEDFKNAPKWSSNLKRAEVLTPGPTGKGTLLRYLLDTPGGEQRIEIEHLTYNPFKTCAGDIVEGPIKGTWKYNYSARGGATRLTYTMTFEPNGFAARLFFGVIERQLPVDTRRTLESLKRYIESGKGPKGSKASQSR